MARLHLADGLRLPADEAATQKYGFIGRSGSGKSYAAMKLAELFLQSGAQIIALDWVGIWWSLRLAVDGKQPGFEHVYIFGGEHADVDLRPESGALMADLIVDKHISVVLDVMHFRKAERTRFATAFAEQFFHRKKTARTACHLFIEEAQAYLPQMVRGEEARMVGVFEDIGKVGRNYGIGNSLISQRPQAINKDVLNQVEVLLAFQTNGPQERKAIAGWTAENTTAGVAMMQELPTLPVGDALVWSPQWLRIAQRVHIAERTTYNASSTPTQKAKAIAPRTLAPADLEALGAEIKATIERTKADDPKELKRQIADLQRQLKAVKPAAVEHTIIEKPVLKDGQIDRLGPFLDRAEQLAAKYAAVAAEIRSAIASTAARPVVAPRPVVARPAPAPKAATARVPHTNGNDITPAKQKILNALAFLSGIGVTPADKTQLALIVGVSPSSGSYFNNLGALRSAGLIDYPTQGTAQLTAIGEAVASVDGVPATTDELHNAIRAKLPPAKWKILEALIAVYPNTLAKDALAEQIGVSPTSGSYFNNLGSLRSLGLIDYPRQSEAAALPVLFLES